MDLNFTPEEIAFRDEARRFFRTAVPDSIRNKVAEGEGLTRDDMINAQRILNARGWATVNWPVEWGGQDWTPIQVYLYQDEMQQANVPAPIAFNVSMVGPVIAQFANQAIKERFLPATANADIFWCQGFSEPGSGSDLASLRTKAEKRDGKYVINGQKDLDHAGAVCRLDFLSLPHRSGGEGAGGDFVHPGGHEDAGHHRAPDRHHRRRPRGQRSIFR